MLNFRYGSVMSYVEELIKLGKMSRREAQNIATGSKRVRVSKYQPHQSEKECARRRAQIAKGTLKGNYVAC